MRSRSEAGVAYCSSEKAALYERQEEGGSKLKFE